jgi:malonyl-CoA decarboxylase
MAPGGTAALVGMRREFLRDLADHPERAALDADLSRLFRSWFNPGFLSLQRIDWSTSALILERLIQYEAVHQIQGWRDLRRRLERDRCCFAFFHPALADEPLIFIEVALTRGLSSKVQSLLDPDSAVLDPKTANCAVFYSITNCQEGLRGISFGNHLIARVTAQLGHEFPHLRTFATISPLPGFRDWLCGESAAGIRRSAELADFLAAAQGSTPPSPPAHLQRELTAVCAYYLTRARRGKMPFDPVARFHLANGARLERLNWMGDVSSAGLKRAFGFTVNYVYRLGELDRNHDTFARGYRVVVSRQIDRLAQSVAVTGASGRHANER